MADTTKLDDIAAEVSALRDLFERRLLEDKAKARLYDELYAQVEYARYGLARSQLRPLFGELILLIDRLRGSAENAVVASVTEELEEMLRRRDVRQIPPVDQFDPWLHEAARVELDPDATRGQVLAVLRNGYLIGDEVLRPALVVVASAPGAAEPATVPAINDSDDR